jgi:hypothetical protein
MDSAPSSRRGGGDEAHEFEAVALQRGHVAGGFVDFGGEVAIAQAEDDRVVLHGDLGQRGESYEDE